MAPESKSDEAFAWRTRLPLHRPWVGAFTKVALALVLFQPAVVIGRVVQHVGEQAGPEVRVPSEPGVELVAEPQPEVERQPGVESEPGVVAGADPESVEWWVFEPVEHELERERGWDDVLPPTGSEVAHARWCLRTGRSLCTLEGRTMTVQVARELMDEVETPTSVLSALPADATFSEAYESVGAVTPQVIRGGGSVAADEWSALDAAPTPHAEDPSPTAVEAPVPVAEGPEVEGPTMAAELRRTAALLSLGLQSIVHGLAFLGFGGLAGWLFTLGRRRLEVVIRQHEVRLGDTRIPTAEIVGCTVDGRRLEVRLLGGGRRHSPPLAAEAEALEEVAERIRGVALSPSDRVAEARARLRIEREQARLRVHLPR